MMTTAICQFPFMPSEKGEKKDTPVGRWLRSLRAANGLEQEDLAPIVNRGRSSVAGYERGNPMPRDVFEALLKEFPNSPPPRDVDLPPGLIAPKADSPLGPASYLDPIPYVEIRYAGEVPASSWGDPLAADTTIEVDAKYGGRHRFVAKVVGDSCYPALKQGDLTVWESDRNPPHGVIVIAEREEGAECTVKQLIYDAEQGRDVLKPVNPRFDSPPDGLGWHATARLVGVVRKADGPERTWFLAQGLRPRHLIENSED